MAADALAPRVARASAAMVLTVQVRHVLVHYEEEFQPHGPSQYWEITENVNTVKPLV